MRNFKEGTIEMRETSEEAVVKKDARVTGEVVVRKDVDEKTETVRDTVRKTDVKVDRVDDSKRGNSPSAGTTRNTTNTTQGGGPACNT
jgi:stress response protein YsnF